MQNTNPLPTTSEECGGFGEWVWQSGMLSVVEDGVDACFIVCVVVVRLQSKY